MTSPLLLAAHDALRAHLPPHIEVVLDEGREVSPRLHLGCGRCPDHATLTLDAALRFNGDRLADACCRFAARFMEKHLHESEAQPEEQRSPKPQAAGSTPARLATLAGASSTVRAEASPAGSTLRPPRALPDGSPMVERAAAAGLPSPAEPAPRPASPLAALAAHYGLRAPARLEQLRALAARCRRLWAANPGVTGWVMREHRVGVNLACLLVEEHVARLTGAAEA